tara:strand:+ start:2465 stop:3670 length:1206 start_codon:yes stop_codon:yes gene_type:complete
MYTKKNLPQSQYELSQGKKQEAYGRQNDIRRDDDKFNDLKIGLYDLDYCIKWYFDNTIKPTVDDFGRNYEVPVVYGSPEKWKQVQEDGFLRDVGGKILKPIIMYKRTAVAKNRALGNKIDANFPQLYRTQEFKYNKQNRYDQFSVVTNLTPQRSFINTVIPEYIDLTYEVVIWSDYVDHMNSIVESVVYSEGSYWGEPERFKFRTKIDDFTNETDQLADADRVVKTTFTLTLFGYIVPDVLVKHLSKHLSEKTLSVQQLNTEINVDADSSVFEDTQSQGVGPSVEIPTPPTEAVPNPVFGGEVDPAVLTYLNTSKTLLASLITIPDTAVFNAGFLAAPSGLPTTSAANFQFYVNGQLVEPAAITSFVDNGDGTSTLVIDTSELGFTLASSDEILAVGKFDI